MGFKTGTEDLKALATGLFKRNKTTESDHGNGTSEKKPSQLEIRTESIMKKSGWDHQTAREALVRAKQQYGIRYFEYDKHDLYRFPESDLEKEWQRIVERRQRRKQRIDTVSEALGITQEEAKALIREARSERGIPARAFVRHKLYELPPEEQGIAYEEILKKKKEREERREARRRRQEIREQIKEHAKGIEFIRSIDMDLSKEEALKIILEATERLDITEGQFMSYGLFGLSDEEQAMECQKWQELIDSKANDDADASDPAKPSKMQIVLDRTGWTEEEWQAQFDRDVELTGCSLKEWMTYNFDLLTDQQKKDLFMKPTYRLIRKKYRKKKEFIQKLWNKEVSNEYLADYMNRVWCTNRDLTYDGFVSTFRHCRGVIYKPSFGTQGKFIEAFMFDQHSMKEIYDIVTAYPRGVIEEYLIQHPVLSKLNPDSVNTMRIVSLSHFDKYVLPGKHADIAYAALRVGGGHSAVDNFHSDGVCVGIDLYSGEVITDGVDLDGNVYPYHPVTKERFRGTVIPFFQEAKELVLRAVEELQIHGLIGLDIAITEKGPEVIEINGLPDPVLLTAPYAAEHRGMRKYMERYLHE